MARWSRGLQEGGGRLLGGSLVSVVLKLAFLSLVIGAIMAGFGLTPTTIPARLLAAAKSLANLGFGAFRDLGRYMLTGAIVVVPIWLILRLLAARR